MYRTKKQVLESKETTPPPIMVSPITLPQPVIMMDTPAYWYEGKVNPKPRYMRK